MIGNIKISVCISATTAKDYFSSEFAESVFILIFNILSNGGSGNFVLRDKNQICQKRGNN
jgi:hypothetical protein